MRTPFAILTDTTLCTGCEKCVEACRSENSLGEDVPRRWKSRIDDLSSTRYTTIVRRRDKEKPGLRFVRRQCRHCLEPACVSACLVGALQKTREGPVTYDPDKCMGCRYCMVACPYGIPRYQWDKPVPEVCKCDMCYERIKDGKKEPACVEACPEKATIFGDREELRMKASRRIEENPDKYFNKIFGETEVGGTSVLYISDISLDFLGCQPELGEVALPDLTWAALSKVPYLSGGAASVMTGVWWIIGRRMKLAEEAKRSSIPGEETQREGPEATQPTENDEEKQGT